MNGRHEDEFGTVFWFLNSELHRVDGPAVEFADGDKAWFIKGLKMTEEEFNQCLEKMALNEKLQSTLEPKPTEKRLKI